jgi:hypothetical protein
MTTLNMLGLIVLVAGLSVLLYGAAKTPPPSGSQLLKWRGMTVTSPPTVFWLMVIVGLAVLITILCTGHINEVKSPDVVHPKDEDPGQ